MSKYPVELKSHLDQAITNLQSANDALGKGQYDTAVSHAAESAFHTGSVLLLNEDKDPGELGDVNTLLQQIFVQGRRLTKEQGANLGWLLALRNAEIRTSGTLTAEEAHRAVEIAHSFFESAKVILDS